MKTIIKSAKIIDPNSSFNNKVADVLIEDGIVKSIKSSIKSDASMKIIKHKDLHVSPGLFDLKVNFRDPGMEWKEDLCSGVAAAEKGGFTGVLLMPTVTPVCDNKVQIDYIKNKTANNLVEVVASGSITNNAKGEQLSEMYDMHNAGAKAFTDVKNLSNVNLIKLALQYTKTFNSLIINQPNDKNLSAEGSMNEGVTSTQLGLKGIPNVSEEIALSKDIEILRYTGGKLHVSCITTAKSVELIKNAKAEGLHITSDVAIHNLILDDEFCEKFDTNYKVFPPLRSKADVSALIKGIKEGVIDAICTDHSPEDIDNKQNEFSNAAFGIIGLQTAFSLANQIGIKAEEIITLLSVNPRKILELEVPKIETECKANLFCYLPNETYQLEEKDIASKSKNTPFLNQDLKAKVIGTLRGKNLYLNI